jgi:hypothetical protein
MSGYRGHDFFLAYTIIATLFIVVELGGMLFKHNSEDSNISYGTQRPLDSGAATMSAFPVEQDYTTLLLSRPLFRRDRATVHSVSPSVAMPPPLNLPKLSAIVINLNQAFAVFSDSAGRSTSVTNGEYYNNLRVMSINADGVQVATPSGTTILHLRNEELSDTENPETPPGNATGVNSWPDK